MDKADLENIERKERRKYQRIYEVGYNHYAGLKSDIVKQLDRLAPEFGSAIELGCGTGKYAHYLAERHGKSVVGVDIVNKVAYPDVPFHDAFVWNLDIGAEFIYAIDLLEHVPESTVAEVVDRIADNAPLFFADVSTLIDQLGDKIGDRLHLTVREPRWWLEQFARRFSQVRIIEVIACGFFMECRKNPNPVIEPQRLNDYPAWETVFGEPTTSYRDFWNQHAFGLDWQGPLLFLGSNDACRRYYSAEFFGVTSVIHVDPDPATHPDVVARAENLAGIGDGSVGGVAFFGTPYVIDDPRAAIEEMSRVVSPGGMISGSFNGRQSAWGELLYRKGQTKNESERWFFDERVIDLFDECWEIVYWVGDGDEYFYVTAVRK